MATRTARIFARFFDLAFCFILFTPSLFIAPENHSLKLICLGLILFYWLFQDGLGGQSIGKRFVHIGIINEQSRETCTFFRSIVRNAALIMTLPIDLLCFLRRDKRRLGDLIAGTVVVREENMHHWR
jgi:uncharacterized RDD family membrane protein YckC